MQTELNFATAESAKQSGMQLAENNANRKTIGWSNVAMEHLKGYLLGHNCPFLAEEVRSYAKANGLEDAPSQRAWGGVMARAARCRIIKSIGFRLTSNPNAHRTPATLWCKA